MVEIIAAMITIKMKNINIVFCEKNGIIPTNN
jgi:hypothetical protein